MTDEERASRFRQQVERAGEEALSKGITTFHDAGTGFRDIRRLEEMAREDELPVRLYVMVRGESDRSLEEELGDYRLEGVGDGFLTVRAVKSQIDGALGTHGAWLLEPYADQPERTGLPQRDPDDLRRTAEIVRDHGFQLNTHAIGDRGNREVLDIYEDVLGETEDHRWRIEHAQHLHPDDTPRFGELGVVASMQGVHATSDGPWVKPRIGTERARTGAYAWRAVLDSGAVICNGTDAPVEDVDPLASYRASVTRLMADGEAFFPEQRMSRQEALESYTRACTYASFQEDRVGTIAPGKWADLVVLSDNPLTVPDEGLEGLAVEHTILGREIRYSG